KEPHWYARCWTFVKKEYVTNVAIAVFTGVLAAVSIFQGHIMLRQLEVMQASQRPFVTAEAHLANDWTSDSEHDIQITIAMVNHTSYPAVNLLHSDPQISMGTIADMESVIAHCKVEYPKNSLYQIHTIPPFGPGMRPDALPTVRTAYISEKQR